MLAIFQSSGTSRLPQLQPPCVSALHLGSYKNEVSNICRALQDYSDQHHRKAHEEEAGFKHWAVNM